jgi:hypothetical protein
MTNLLDIQHKNGQQVTVENINSVVDQIGKLYDDTAKSTLGLRHVCQSVVLDKTINKFFALIRVPICRSLGFWGSISLVTFTDYFPGTLSNLIKQVVNLSAH